MFVYIDVLNDITKIRPRRKHYLNTVKPKITTSSVSRTIYMCKRNNSQRHNYLYFNILVITSQMYYFLAIDVHILKTNILVGRLLCILFDIRVSSVNDL